MSRQIVAHHEQKIDEALDAASEDSGLDAHEYGLLLESTVSRCESALDALREEGLFS